MPIGMRPGQPHQVVQAGFNLWQAQADNYGFYAGSPFELPDDALSFNTDHGLLYYTQARAANSLTRKKPSPPGPVGKYGNFPPLITPDGTPFKTRAHKNAANTYYPGTRAYLTDYMQKLGADSPWSATPTARPTLFWGMDNEWEAYPDHSPQARAAYAAWLPKKFKNIDDLNRTWGTQLPSFAAIADSASYLLPPPNDFAKRPAEYLAWHTFQSEHFTTLLADLAHTLHTADPQHRPIVYKSTQQTIDMPFTHRNKPYDNVIFGERTRSISGGLQGSNIYGAGDRQSYEINYITNIIRPLDGNPGDYGTMCPETNNHGGPGHQWAATFWRVLPNGLKAVNFFTTGYEGAKGDYASFGHFAPDGTPRSKMFYAARWAHMVHRTETLWKESAPAPGLPRLALLLPRRDSVLSERTDRRVSKWAYPMNHRVMVYGWLREQGYWVDVIPETKLDAAYLTKNYNALVLIGAEHLAETEAAAITHYVRNGGVLLADERPGHFDELHREKRQLEPILGVALGRYDNTPASRFTFGKRQAPLTGVRATGRLDVRTTTSTTKTLLATDDARPLVTTNTAGNGRVIHLAFMTGDLREDVNLPVEVSTFASSHGNETADTGDAATPQPGGAISRWLASLLRDAGVAPAYKLRGRNITAADAAIIRVEQPVVDSRGNLAIVATVRGSADPAERVPATTLELPLPGGPWTRALWAPAEDAGLVPVEVTSLKGDKNHHRVKLPAIESAGVLYLLKNYSPLIGIPKIDTPDRAIDGHAARIRPGVPFQVKVQLVDQTAASATTTAGKLRLAAVQGWTVTPAEIPTDQATEVTFTVTPPAEASALKRNWLYPLVARWSDSTGTDRAICAANVEAKLTQ